MTKEELLKLREEVLKYEKPNEIEKIIPKMSAYQFLYECSKNRLDAFALNYLGRKYTYRELFEKIDEVENGFRAKGVVARDKVAMSMLATPEAIISFYALNKIGATVFMVNGTHEKPAIREELIESEAKLLVINSIFYDKDVKSFADEANIPTIVAPRLDESFPILFYLDKAKFKFVEALKKIGSACNSDERCMSWNDLLELGKKSKLNVEPFYEERSIAVIASTSGSTGKPKRPALSNEAMNVVPIQMGMSCDAFAPNDTIFTTLPPWIVYSLFNSIHEPLCLGVTVELDPLFNSKKVSKRFKQYRIDHWNSIPSYIEDMNKDRGMKGLNITTKSITTGGDYRTPGLKAEGEATLKRNGSDCEIGQGYGLTEIGGCYSYTYEKNMAPEGLGKPLVGNTQKVIDSATGKELGPNETGELYLYSPAMMEGYYNDPVATEKVLITDDNGVKWFKTDDMAHYDEWPQLFLDGRKRRIEISRDANGTPTKVFPDKVKQILSLHPGIEQCEIIMVPDDKRITKPVAFVVLKNNVVMDNMFMFQLNELYKNHNIESYTIPVAYNVIDEIPRLKSQKTDYEKLMEMYNSSNKEKTGLWKVLSLVKRKTS